MDGSVPQVLVPMSMVPHEIVVNLCAASFLAGVLACLCAKWANEQAELDKKS